MVPLAKKEVRKVPLETPVKSKMTDGQQIRYIEIAVNAPRYVGVLGYGSA